MAQFTTTSLKCQCTRDVKLYASVYDPRPVNIPLTAGIQFYSRKQYHSDTVDMVYISEGINCETTPVGYWCPFGCLKAFPIIEEESPVEVRPDGSVSVDVELYINATGASVYTSPDGMTTTPNGLAVGDRVYCDRKVNVSINGMEETRYRISSVRGDDQTLTGSWITLNRAIVNSDGPTINIHNPMVRMARSMSMRSASHSIMMMSADDGGGGGGGGSTGGAATIDGNRNGVSYGTNARPGNYSGENVGTGKANTNIKTPSGETVTVPDAPTSDSTGANDNTTGNTYESINMADPSSYDELYKRYGFSYTATTDTSLMGIPVGRMLFVHGMPFQYTHITDRRGHSVMAWGASANEDTEGPVTSGVTDMYGRSFAANIAANMPIAVIAPGKPKFLTSVKDGMFSYAAGKDPNQDRNNWFGFFNNSANGAEGAEGGLLEKLAEGDGDYQYFSLRIDTMEYFKYVNSLCQTSARLMDLGNVTYRGQACSSIDWGDYNEAAEQDFSTVEMIIGLAKGVSFAFDPQSSVSDTINNTTQDSQFSTMFNNISSKARELEFILGYSGGDIPGFIDSTNYVQADVPHMSGGIASGITNVFKRVGSWINNSAHGMNVRFPEIWSESNYSKSYDIDMHFIAPYATHFCKWRYVLVPFFHIFALAAPISGKNVSQYSSPFLIRAYSKGFFNVEMGIIESITWKRFGDKDMISEDGIPMQIDVSVSFKDLYHALAMSAIGNEFIESADFFNNSGLMDLVGTLSGVNMNRISLAERMSLFIGSSWTAFGALGSNFMRHISDRVRDVADRYFFGI